MNSIATKISALFSEKFSTAPSVYYSPGRINLIGEHIDYNDGYVMPAAIDKGVYFAVATNKTDILNFYAVDFDDSLSIAINEIKKLGDWKNYVLSVVNEFVLLGKSIGGFDCISTDPGRWPLHTQHYLMLKPHFGYSFTGNRPIERSQ